MNTRRGFFGTIAAALGLYRAKAAAPPAAFMSAVYVGVDYGLSKPAVVYWYIDADGKLWRVENEAKVNVTFP